jgi:hypothetical protein
MKSKELRYHFAYPPRTTALMPVAEVQPFDNGVDCNRHAPSHTRPVQLRSCRLRKCNHTTMEWTATGMPLRIPAPYNCAHAGCGSATIRQWSGLQQACPFAYPPRTTALMPVAEVQPDDNGVDCNRHAPSHTRPVQLRSCRLRKCNQTTMVWTATGMPLRIPAPYNCAHAGCGSATRRQWSGLQQAAPWRAPAGQCVNTRSFTAAAPAKSGRERAPQCPSGADARHALHAMNAGRD